MPIVGPGVENQVTIDAGAHSVSLTVATRDSRVMNHDTTQTRTTPSKSVFNHSDAKAR